jgi:pSer/pThr/pTyr-binding forkhead associated (FHA) protein
VGAPQARLVFTRSDGSRVEFALSKPVMLVGRDPGADIPVTEPLVSWAHARLERREDAWVVQDLGSTNLTRVNGEAVAERPLRHGDELRFARAVCQFLLDTGPDLVAGGV